MPHFSFRQLVPAALGVLLAVTAGQAQSPDSLRAIPERLAHYRQQNLQQKLYLHIDRPLYLTGETMWFKVYNTDGYLNQPLTLETTAYVEVLDRTNRPVLQGKVALRKGTGQGSFQLPATLTAGNYTVRAYTGYMRNYSPELYFHATITVINTAQPSASVPAPDTLRHEVAFFPEGGQLVSELTSRVGVKVADPAGRGVLVQGVVQDRTGATVATLTTPHVGLGSFLFTPQAAKAPYTAVLTLPSGRVVRRALPAARPAGVVVQLSETSAQQLTLTVRASSPATVPVYLLAQARLQPAVATSGQLLNGQATFVIDKSKLADGVTHFTLFDENRRPLAERLYFLAPRQPLTITARPDRAELARREKVTLQLATAQAGRALPAGLSVAVYRLDSLATGTLPNINTYLWLTSELAGNVENPDYYFSAPSPEVAQAADNLMLTHGWSRFRWEDVLGNQPLPRPYLPELQGLLVRGRLTQKGTNQPAPGITTYLASPSQVTRLNNSVSAADGSVQFELQDYYGSRDLIAQTNLMQDSLYRLEILDPFSAVYARYQPGRLFLREQLRPAIAERHFQQQVHNGYAGKNRFVIPYIDSTAFFGQPDERFLLDEYVRFPAMEEVMREYVPGVKVRLRKGRFDFAVLDNPNRTLLTQTPLVLLDGVPVFDFNKIMALNPLRVKKLEVVDSRFFQGRTMYSGIISYSTYSGHLDGFQLDPRALAQEYEGWQLKREFYAPRYDTPEQQQSRLADFRNLLYWNPEVSTAAAGTTSLDFFTSDQPGRYLVVVQGLTATGAAGTTSFVLNVRQPL